MTSKREDDCGEAISPTGLRRWFPPRLTALAERDLGLVDSFVCRTFRAGIGEAGLLNGTAGSHQLVHELGAELWFDGRVGGAPPLAVDDDPLRVFRRAARAITCHDASVLPESFDASCRPVLPSLMPSRRRSTVPREQVDVGPLRKPPPHATHRAALRRGARVPTIHAMSSVTRVIAMLVCDDIQATHDFLVAAFDFDSGGVEYDGDGHPVHGEVRGGNAVIWLHAVSPEHDLAAPAMLPSASGGLVVHVEDVDAHYRHAADSGAIISLPPDRPRVRTTGVRSSRPGGSSVVVRHPDRIELRSGPCARVDPGVTAPKCPADRRVSDRRQLSRIAAMSRVWKRRCPPGVTTDGSCLTLPSG